MDSVPISLHRIQTMTRMALVNTLERKGSNYGGIAVLAILNISRFTLCALGWGWGWSSDGSIRGTHEVKGGAELPGRAYVLWYKLLRGGLWYKLPAHSLHWHPHAGKKYAQLRIHYSVILLAIHLTLLITFSHPPIDIQPALSLLFIELCKDVCHNQPIHIQISCFGERKVIWSCSKDS